MAPENEPNDEGLEFERIQGSRGSGSASTPDTEGGTLHPTGLLPLNKKGSALWAGIIRDQGLHEDKAACVYGYNKAKNVVSVYAVDPLSDQDPTAFRWIGKKKEKVSLHIGPVFDQVPDIRPTGKRSVVVSRIKDKSGTPCLAIYLNIALVRRTNRRGPAKQVPDGNAAPGADPGAEDDTEA